MTMKERGHGRREASDSNYRFGRVRLMDGKGANRTAAL